MNVKGTPNPADMMTKHLDSRSIAEMMGKLGLLVESGRSSIAPQVADDDGPMEWKPEGEYQEEDICSLEVIEDEGSDDCVLPGQREPLLPELSRLPQPAESQGTFDGSESLCCNVDEFEFLDDYRAEDTYNDCSLGRDLIPQVGKDRFPLDGESLSVAMRNVDGALSGLIGGVSYGVLVGVWVEGVFGHTLSRDVYEYDSDAGMTSHDRQDPKTADGRGVGELGRGLLCGAEPAGWEAEFYSACIDKGFDVGVKTEREDMFCLGCTAKRGVHECLQLTLGRGSNGNACSSSFLGASDFETRSAVEPASGEFANWNFCIQRAWLEEGCRDVPLVSYLEISDLYICSIL